MRLTVCYYSKKYFTDKYRLGQSNWTNFKRNIKPMFFRPVL